MPDPTPIPPGTSSRDAPAAAPPVNPKPRKAYVLTKTRESWSEEEHARFVQALRLYARDWKRIEEHVGTKSATQIRSHAQKHFYKALQQGEDIPPPRAKRRNATAMPKGRQQGQDPQQSSSRQSSQRPAPVITIQRPGSVMAGEGGGSSSEQNGGQSTQQQQQWQPHHFLMGMSPSLDVRMQGNNDQDPSGASELLHSVNPMAQDNCEAGLLPSVGLFPTPMMDPAVLPQGLPLGGYFPGGGGFLGSSSCDSSQMWIQQQQQQQQHLMANRGSCSGSLAGDQAPTNGGGGGGSMCSGMPLPPMLGSSPGSGLGGGGGSGYYAGGSSSNLLQLGQGAQALAAAPSHMAILPGGTRVQGGLGAAEFSHLISTSAAGAPMPVLEPLNQGGPLLDGSGKLEGAAEEGPCPGMASSEEDQSIGSNQQGSGTDGDGSGTKDGSGTEGGGGFKERGALQLQKSATGAGGGSSTRHGACAEGAGGGGLVTGSPSPVQHAPLHSSVHSSRSRSGTGGASGPSLHGTGMAGSNKRPRPAPQDAGSTEEEDSFADVLLRPFPKGKRTSHASRCHTFMVEPSPSPGPMSPLQQHRSDHQHQHQLPHEARPFSRSAPLNSSSSSHHGRRSRARSSSAQSYSTALPGDSAPAAAAPPPGLHRLARSWHQPQLQQQQQEVQEVRQLATSWGAESWMMGGGAQDGAEQAAGQEGLSTAGVAAAAPNGKWEEAGTATEQQATTSKNLAQMIQEFQQVDDYLGPLACYSTGESADRAEQLQQRQRLNNQQNQRQHQQQAVLVQQQQQSLGPFPSLPSAPLSSTFTSSIVQMRDARAPAEGVTQHAYLGSSQTVTHAIKLESGADAGMQVAAVASTAAAAEVHQQLAGHQHHHQHVQQQQQQQQQVVSAHGGDSGEGDVGSNSTDEAEPPAAPGEPPTRAAPATAFCGDSAGPEHAGSSRGGKALASGGLAAMPAAFSMPPSLEGPFSYPPASLSLPMDSLPAQADNLLPFLPTRDSPPDSATLAPLAPPSPPLASNDSAYGLLGATGGGGGSGGGGEGDSEGNHAPAPSTAVHTLSMPEGRGLPVTATGPQSSESDIDALLN